MMIKDSILIGILALTFGLIFGLILRIQQEKISKEYFFRALNVSIKYLIIYPFFMFPIIVYLFKDDIADAVTDQILKEYKPKVKGIRKQTRSQIIKQLTFKTIIKIWFKFMGLITKDYDEYIDINMKLVKSVVEREKRVKSQKYYIKNQNEMDELYRIYCLT